MLKAATWHSNLFWSKDLATECGSGPLRWWSLEGWNVFVRLGRDEIALYTERWWTQRLVSFCRLFWLTIWQYSTASYHWNCISLQFLLIFCVALFPFNHCSQTQSATCPFPALSFFFVGRPFWSPAFPTHSGWLRKVGKLDVFQSGGNFQSSCGRRKFPNPRRGPYYFQTRCWNSAGISPWQLGWWVEQKIPSVNQLPMFW